MKKILFLFNAPAMGLRYGLVNDFAEQGFECSVALPESDIAAWVKLCPKVHFIPFNAFSGTSIGILNNLKTFFAIKTLIKSTQPEIVFLGNVKPNIYGGIAAYRCKVPRIYGLISGLGYAFIDEPGLKRSLIKKICLFLYKRSFKHATHVFFQNHDDRDLFVKKQVVDEQKTSVVPGTGVDLSRFQPQPFPKQLTFFMAARLIKEKGVFFYVEAAKLIKQRHPDVKFVLGGNIDTNPSAITARQLNACANEVEYIGFVQDMSQMMPQCSVFVYPSYYREGVPRTLLEALACGRPVITTDNIGCRETMENGINGYKIPIKSTEALAEAIENFIQNPESIALMGQQGRQLAENKFDLHKVNDQIVSTVQSAAS